MIKLQNIFTFFVQNSFYKIDINDIIAVHNYIDCNDYILIIVYKNGIELKINFFTDKFYGKQIFAELIIKIK